MQSKRAGTRPGKPGGNRRRSVEQWGLPTPDGTMDRRQSMSGARQGRAERGDDVRRSDRQPRMQDMRRGMRKNARASKRVA